MSESSKRKIELVVGAGKNNDAKTKKKYQRMKRVRLRVGGGSGKNSEVMGVWTEGSRRLGFPAATATAL